MKVKKLKRSVLSVATLSILASGCLRVEADLPFNPLKENSSSKRKSNLVTNESLVVNEQIGDENIKLQVLSESEFQMQRLAGNILGASAIETNELLNNLPSTNTPAKSIQNKTMLSGQGKEKSLLLGLPIGLIGEQSIFGGVITKVSDKSNDTLGALKLTDLSPLHVRTMTTTIDGKPAITLVGCPGKCDEESEQVGLINFPIVGVDKAKDQVILDLSAIGKELDLITMMDPTGAYTKLRAISSSTTTFDYSLSTLVFDVKTKMIPVGANPTNPATPITEFTVRWYLKLNSAFNPAFISRTPTEGVGFFQTERSKETKITRFSTTNFGNTVKYYIKNVPKQYQTMFAAAFENWNKEFTQIIGRNLLSYEFIEANDPRSKLLIPGDIRYNIVEWDLDNKAPYGGLGPSIANQFTGETLSANVLIQGPTIIELYTRWFQLSSKARSLIAAGRNAEANKLIADFNREADQEMAERRKVKFALKLGQNLEMNVHGQRVELEDPMIKNNFEIVPEGVTYEQYMTGYFGEMLAHELGHNLGLRHNFKGNLGATETRETGSVSRSIMEYLGRPFRHLNAIGEYDRMAISFGYRGMKPKNLNWFCTDEDQGSDKLTLLFKSPECTKSDATNDPFSFWESRMARAIEMLIDTKSTSAPVWKPIEIASQIDEAVTGLVSYAASAERTATTWTNFFGKLDRPNEAKDVKAYVLEAIKKKLCDPDLATIIASKESAEAEKLAQENLDMMKKMVAIKTASLGVFSTTDLRCELVLFH